ncbi:MAG: GntR family transcriptional regulator [Roseitalea sp.]|jgi:DNA-binding GntR family transcriptional regulator|nr:GntR family transcriptional regulator [Roseitalea sp.]MBO6720986.1 GntR family transcriptional regulator [Roseitalea sp.]MBO6742942.1 GntR family transcriptional regulator [Roseitalea sp.]
MAGRKAHIFDQALAEGFDPDDYSRSMSMGECIARHLRGKIINAELKPGDTLPEASVARAFDTSRAPVRDAMRLLASEGLVNIASQSGNYVAPINSDDVRNGAFIRSTVEERNVADLAETINEAGIARLEGLITEQDKAVTAKDFAWFHQLDEAFHETLFDLTDRHSVWHYLQSVKVHIDRARTLTLPGGQTARRAVEDHRRIVAALVKGDRKAAADAMTVHLGRIHDLIAAAQDREPGGDAVPTAAML